MSLKRYIKIWLLRQQLKLEISSMFKYKYMHICQNLFDYHYLDFSVVMQDQFTLSVLLPVHYFRLIDFPNFFIRFILSSFENLINNKEVKSLKIKLFSVFYTNIFLLNKTNKIIILINIYLKLTNFRILLLSSTLHTLFFMQIEYIILFYGLIIKFQLIKTLRMDN